MTNATPEHHDTRLIRYGYYFLKKTLGTIIRCLWVKQVEGLENLPQEGPVIIASNHTSYLDFLCFIAVSPRYVHYLAAGKFFEKGIWRMLMILTGQIKVERMSKDKKAAYRLVFSALEQGKIIGVFPEGTRSATGVLQPAYTGVAKFALASKAPVVPVGIMGAYEIWSRSDKMPRLKKIVRIKIGKPMTFADSDGSGQAEARYRIVTDTIMEKIAEIINQPYPNDQYSGK